MRPSRDRIARGSDSQTGLDGSYYSSGFWWQPSYYALWVPKVYNIRKRSSDIVSQRKGTTPSCAGVRVVVRTYKEHVPSGREGICTANTYLRRYQGTIQVYFSEGKGRACHALRTYLRREKGIEYHASFSVALYLRKRRSIRRACSRIKHREKGVDPVFVGKACHWANVLEP